MVDECIKEIECFKVSKNKKTLYFFFSIFTLGIINIVCAIFPNLYLKLVCVTSDVHQALYLLITDKDNETEIVEAVIESFYTRNHLVRRHIRGNKMNFRKELEDSKYLGQDYYNKSEETIVTYITPKKPP